jgi:hypothetical protein
MRSPTLPALPAFAFAFALVFVGAIGCRDAVPRDTPRPPIVDFVLAAGDSSFWVTSHDGVVHVRGAPLELARVGGRFYELYVEDDDRSYEDAVLVGQRVYRRDLISGDSLLVYEDSIVPRLAAQYARLHPDDARLQPNEDASDDPLWRATSTVDLTDLHGPFLSYSLHVDVERDDVSPWHTSRRGVIDLTTGHSASLARVASGDLSSIRRRRTLAVSATLDSVRTGGDRIDRARTAALLGSYRLEPDGFTLTLVDGEPAVAYALAGTGAGEAGHLLELPPITIGEPSWWAEVAPTLPIGSADGSRDVWRHGRYEVVVRYDSSASVARLLLRDSTSREWAVGRVPSPALRIFWLDQPPVDSVARRALLRAFDESALYDEAARTASRHVRPARPSVRLAHGRTSVRQRTPSLRHRA